MKKSKHTGRPTKLVMDSDRVKGILQDLEDGECMVHAAARAGISKASLCLWIRRGRQEKAGPYREFYEAAQRARAQYTKRVIGSRNLLHGTAADLFDEVAQEVADANIFPAIRERLISQVWKRFRAVVRRKKKGA